MYKKSEPLMKILFINDPALAFDPNGERLMNEITVKMDKRWEIHSIHSGARKYENLSCIHKTHVISLLAHLDLIIPKIMYILFSIYVGVKLIKKHKINVVMTLGGHVHLGLAAYLVARITRRKCIVRVSSDVGSEIVFFLQRVNVPVLSSKISLRIVRDVAKKLEMFLFKHMDCSITHSPMDYEKIKQMLGRVTFIPLWVDAEKFSPLSDNLKSQLKKELFGNVNSKIVFFVGRLHPEKDVATLIHAFGEVIEELENVILAIVGIGPEEDKLRKMSNDLNIQKRVKFLGFITHDHLPKYYNASDVYVLPSLREAWSNTIMEAMASGVPVIATNTPANPYLIKNGKTGFLVPPQDPSALAEKISYVLKHPKRVIDIISNARCEIKKYEKDYIGELYKNSILEIVNEQN